MKRIALTFGLLAAAMLLLLQLSKYSMLNYGLSSEMMVIGFAVVFITFGIIVARAAMKPKPEVLKVVEPPPVEVDKGKIDELGISKREYEVLEQIAEGKSNQEIAETLFISQTTVKTHVSSLLVKLNARRRTQAVSNAREMGIL